VRGGEGSGGARAGKKAGEREREGEVAVGWDPVVGGASWQWKGEINADRWVRPK
jgi:hypothetical protein